MEYKIAELKSHDKPLVLGLLAAGDLVMEDILAEGTRYWGAFSRGELISVIGCEYQGRCALLRSAFVHEQHRGKSIAAKLTETMFDAARDAGLKTVYAFSTDAGEYWTRQGFTEVPVKEVAQKMYDCCQVRLFDSMECLPTEVTYKYELSLREQG